MATARSTPIASATNRSSVWWRRIRAMPSGSATCRSGSQQHRRREAGAGRWRRRARRLSRQPRDPRASGGAGSAQRRVAARPVGQPQQDRRREAGAGRWRRRARRLSRRASRSASVWRRRIRAIRRCGSATCSASCGKSPRGCSTSATHPKPAWSQGDYPSKPNGALERLSARSRVRRLPARKCRGGAARLPTIARPCGRT